MHCSPNILLSPWLTFSLLTASLTGLLSAQTLDTALDVTGITWDSTGYKLQNEFTKDGVDAAQIISPTTTLSPGKFSGTVTGPTQLTYWVKTSCGEGKDFFEFTLDDFILHRRTGETEWTQQTAYIPAGVHQISYNYRKESTGRTGFDAVWLDSFALSNTPAVSVAELLDFPEAQASNFSITTLNTDSTAHFSSPITESGVSDCIAFKGKAPGTSSSITFTYTSGSPVVVKFRWKAVNSAGVAGDFAGLSTTSPTDILSTVNLVSPANWRETTLHVRPGSPQSAAIVRMGHIFGTTVYVDEFSFTQMPLVTLEEAVDAAPGSWSSTTGPLILHSPQLFGTEDPDGVILATSSINFTSNITGPAVLSWWQFNGGSLRVNTVSGFYTPTPSASWQQFFRVIPTGTHSVTFRGPSSSALFLDRTRIRSVTVHPTILVSLGEGADAPNLTWATNAGSDIVGVASPGLSPDGVDCISTLNDGKAAGDWVSVQGAPIGRLECTLRGSVNLVHPVLGTKSQLSRSRVLLDVPTENTVLKVEHRSVGFSLDQVSSVAGTDQRLRALANSDLDIEYMQAEDFTTVTGWMGEPGSQLKLTGAPRFNLMLPPGPGTLYMRYWQPAGNNTRINGLSQSGVGWQTQPVEFSFNTTSTLIPVTVDAGDLVIGSITWIPGGRYTLDEALGWPGRTWTTSVSGGTSPWVGITYFNTPAAMTSLLPPGGSASLFTTFEGRGILHIVPTLQTNGHVQVWVDGVLARTIIGPFNSSNQTVVENLIDSAGSHNLEIKILNPSTTPHQGWAGILEVNFVPWVTLPSNYPAEFSVPANFTFGPGLPLWKNTPGMLITPPRLEVNVTGPRFLALSNYGDVQLDGVSIFNNTTSQTNGLYVPAGQHHVGFSGTVDFGRVHSGISVAETTVAEALDEPLLTWTSTPNVLALASSELSDNGDAVILPHRGTTPVSFQATPPSFGLLTFSTRAQSRANFTLLGNTFTNVNTWSLYSMLTQAGTPLIFNQASTTTIANNSANYFDKLRWYPLAATGINDAIELPSTHTVSNPSMGAFSGEEYSSDGVDSLIFNNNISFNFGSAGTCEFELKSITGAMLTGSLGATQNGFHRYRMEVDSTQTLSLFTNGLYALDKMTFFPRVSIANALDTPGSFAWSITEGTIGQNKPGAKVGPGYLTVSQPSNVAPLVNLLSGFVVSGANTEIRFWHRSPQPWLLQVGTGIFEIPASLDWMESRCQIYNGSTTIAVKQFGTQTFSVELDGFRVLPTPAEEQLQTGLDQANLLSLYPADSPIWPLVSSTTAFSGNAIATPNFTSSGMIHTREMRVGVLHGNLKFRYLHGPTAAGQLQLYVNKQLAWTGVETASWQDITIPLAYAQNTEFRWAWVANDASGTAMLDKLEILPYTTTTIPLALDDAATPWANTNFTPASTSPLTNGTEDWVRVNLSAVPGSTALGADVVGPAKLSITYFTTADATPKLVLTVSSSTMSVDLPPSAVLHTEVVEIPTGTTFAGIGGSTGMIYVDNISISTANAQGTLLSALDLDGSPITILALEQAAVVSSPSTNGEDAVIYTGGLKMTLASSGELELDTGRPLIVQASSPGSVRLTDLGPVATNVPGRLFRKTKIHVVGPTTITLSDSTWLDNAVWTPMPIDFSQALGTPGVAWTTGGLSPWIISYTTPSGTIPTAPNTLLAINPRTNGQNGWLSTNLPGPFRLQVTGPSWGREFTLDANTAAYTGITPDSSLIVNTPGPHVLRIDSTSYSTAIDSIEISPVPISAEIAEILDEPQLSFTVNSPLYGTATSILATGDGVCLEAMNPSLLTLTVSISESGSLDFAYSGSLRVTVAGGGVSNPTNFTTSAGVFGNCHLELGAGTHSVTLACSGQLDQFQWQPNVRPFYTALGLTTDTQILTTANPLTSILPTGGISIPGITIYTDLRIKSRITCRYQNTAPQFLPAPSYTSTSELLVRDLAANQNWNELSFTTDSTTSPLSIAGSNGALLGLTLGHSSPLSGLWNTAFVQPTATDSPAAFFDSSGVFVGVVMASSTGKLSVTGPGILTMRVTTDCTVKVGASTPVPVVTSNNALQTVHTLIPNGTHEVSIANNALVNPLLLREAVFTPTTGSPEFISQIPTTWLVVDSNSATPLAWQQWDANGIHLLVAQQLLTSPTSTGVFNFYAENINTSPRYGTHSLPVGSNVLWSQANGLITLTARENLALLRDVQFTASALTPSITEALDANGIDFVVNGTLIPHAIGNNADDSMDAVVFKGLETQAILQTTLTGPGYLRFSWTNERSLTSQNFGFRLNNVMQVALTVPQVNWQEEEIEIPAGVHIARWISNDNGSLDKVSYTPKASFTAWANQYPIGSLPTLSGKVLNDSDADGIPGLLEYAFGLNPNNGDRRHFSGDLTSLIPQLPGLPSEGIALGLDGNYYLELRFTRRRLADLNYTMLASNSLAGPWTPTGSACVVKINGTDWENVKIQDTVPINPTAPRRFVRLAVSPQ